MATSLSRIKSQIEQLQKQADKLQSGIVQRLRKEIEQHGLTAEDLFGAVSTSSSAARAEQKPVRKARSEKAGSATKAAKFGDSNGNTWGGMGKRPQWLRDSLEAGAALDDFLLGTGAKAKVTAKQTTKSAPAKKTPQQPKRQAAAAKREPANPAVAKRAAAKPTPKKPVQTRRARATKAAGPSSSSGAADASSQG